ncbi:ankyrin repeat domain-containing protein [Candidatus Dojkabacteria bacterium]|uniref:Ankyrin repeat domain-containing protein n=1 Tax=Candidatus Dojkabacteria bacterium TaxID=2099670 RepID=A0A3M0Z3J9_9BACT|nr:MAG: ankyrin repeat domain-containing protein [Candidatus Dojkabacteria bacterium]
MGKVLLTDVDAQNNLERTLLHRATERGYLEITRVLLAYGASLNAKDKNVKYLLMWLLIIHLDLL